MFSLNLEELPIPTVHKYLLGAIGPRPICFASTIDQNGNRNLAPFSFFNVFSANPPIVIFSPANSGRTGEPKHTLLNVKEVPEVVINIVNYDMVYQMSLASSPYAKEVDEFIKTGFTPLKSEVVKPFRVKESPVQLECEVIEIKELGKGGGAGNLVICLVKKIHIAENILDDNKFIDQEKIDLVARMGGDWYCRAHNNALFELEKPLTTCGIGIDSLPSHIKNSNILTGNHLGQLGNIEEIPTKEYIAEVKEKYNNLNDKEMQAIKLLNEKQSLEALALLW